MGLHLQSSLSSLLLSSSAIVVVMGAQDSSIWSYGTSNANVENPLYYREAYDVLGDLDKFASLYIKFDSCVYSEAGSAGRNGRNYDDFSALQIVGEGANWWYVGNTPFVQANVAFSLYGVLSGDGSSNSGKGQCSAGTFINSFHTVDGINSLLAALENSGIDLSNIDFPYVEVDNANGGNNNQGDGNNGYGGYVYVKDCVANYEGDYSYLNYANENQGGGGGDNGFGDDAPTEMLEAYFKGLVSYGLRCNANDQFEFASFSGGSCDGRRVNSTIDTMDGINSLFQESATCLQIYSPNDGDDDDIGVLTYSQACEHNLKYCPDPHNQLEKYSAQLRKSLHVKPSTAVIAANVTTGILIGLSAMLLAYAAYMYYQFHKQVASAPSSKKAVPTLEEEDQKKKQKKAAKLEKKKAAKEKKKKDDNKTKSPKSGGNALGKAASGKPVHRPQEMWDDETC